MVGWDASVAEDGGEGEIVGGDLVVAGQMGGESELVKDVVFMRLHDEHDAEGKRGVGSGGAVGIVSAGEAEGEGADGGI